MQEARVEPDLPSLTNGELLKYAVSRPGLDPLTLELVLRVETYINLFGDPLDPEGDPDGDT